VVYYKCQVGLVPTRQGGVAMRSLRSMSHEPRRGKGDEDEAALAMPKERMRVRSVKAGAAAVLCALRRAFLT
jgi:hypothetical protein